VKEMKMKMRMRVENEDNEDSSKLGVCIRSVCKPAE
jgi:hypothetical protein